MSIRENLDIAAYLVVGPENTNGRPVEDIVGAAVESGFTCVQIRSKVASARELIELCRRAAAKIAALERSDTVALLVDDRLDVTLAARMAGIKVDGIHVGQSDIPADVCRELLGADAIVGLSARTNELVDYVRTCDTSGIDYFGAGPLHPTATKPEAGLLASGERITRTLDELTELHRVSPLPVVVGGGVKTCDLAGLKATGVEGFFVVSAIAGADDPAAAASEMVAAWRK